MHYGGYLLNPRNWLMQATSRRISSRRVRERNPCLVAFPEDVAFPASLRGPLDRSHGFQRRIACACRARRSKVQPLLMPHPQ